jgi:hypothetical protein
MQKEFLLIIGFVFFHIKGEWNRRTAGGCRNHPTCMSNPQFLIRTRKATLVTILVSIPYKEGFDAIGFYILQTKCMIFNSIIHLFFKVLNIFFSNFLSASNHKLSKFRVEKLIARSDFVRGPEGKFIINI